MSLERSGRGEENGEVRNCFGPRDRQVGAICHRYLCSALPPSLQLMHSINQGSRLAHKPNASLAHVTETLAEGEELKSASL